MPNKKKSVVEEEVKENVEIKDVEEEKDFDPSSLRPRHPGKRCLIGMRTFNVVRKFDESGISGEGIVIEGVEFAVKTIVCHWTTPGIRGSISIFDNMDEFISIHIKPHPKNKTLIVYDNGEVIRFDKE